MPNPKSKKKTKAKPIVVTPTNHNQLQDQDESQAVIAIPKAQRVQRWVIVLLYLGSEVITKLSFNITVHYKFVCISEVYKIA